MRQYRKLPIFFIVVFICAITFRIVYYNNAPQYIVQPDTQSYLRTGYEIIKNPGKYFLNPDRTPIYPLFLVGITSLEGEHNPKQDFLYFGRSLLIIILLQSMLGLMTILFLSKIISMLTMKQLYKKILIVFLAGNILIFAWEFIFLTESISMFLLTVFLYILIRTNKHPSGINFLLMTIVSFACFLIRPTFIYIPSISILLLLKNPEKKMLIPVIINLFVFLAFLIVFINHNHVNFSYKGVSRISDINILGNILKYNLDVDRAKNIHNWSKKIEEYRILNGEPMPYRFLDFYNPLYFTKDSTYTTLPEFNRKVVIQNLIPYLTGSLLNLPVALTETSGVIMPITKDSNFYSFFNIYFQCIKLTLYLNFLIFPFFIYSVFTYMKNKSQTNFILVAIGTVSVIQIVTAVLLSYGEYGRLITPVLPFLYIFNINYIVHFIPRLIKRSLNM